MGNQLTFEGLSGIEERLKRLDEDASYVQVWDRTDRKQEENLGRFDMTATDALAYLSPDALSADDGGEQGDHLDDFELLDGGHPSEPTVRQIAEAACHWLRDVAGRNMPGERWRRFRMKVYGPKGMKVLDSGTFICRNHGAVLDLTEDAAVQELEIPAPGFEVSAQEGVAKGLRALGDYYAQWGRIVLGSVGRLQGVNNAMLGQLHRQLQSSRDQVDQLVAAILENRTNELELAQSRHAADRADDARTALAREALSQLGEAARAFLGARGMDPELGDVLGAIGGSPELMKALSEPGVQALMRDPANLSSLAQMLRAAGEQAKAAKGLEAGGAVPSAG